MLTGSALHETLLAQLRLSRGDVITSRFFKAFYENGMEPAWILIYDIRHELLDPNSPLADDDGFYHERRAAMGQGMRVHMDTILDFERGWS